jgi:hypothetical protein
MSLEPRRDAAFADLLAETAERMAALHTAGRPGVLRAKASLFGVDEVFGWIAAAHPPVRESMARQKIRALHRARGLLPPEDDDLEANPGRPAEMYRAGGMLLDATPYLPRSTETFGGWLDRARAALGGPFGMQAPGIECASWDALHRLQALLAPVLRTTGPRSYRYNAFLGDYPSTPFGFHIDPHQEGVFQAVVHGRRKALFWDGRSLREADAEWLEDSNELSEPPRPPDAAFDLEPGDIVFWPGTHVHGMLPDGPSLAVSMVIDRASPRTRAEVISTLEIATLGGRTALPKIDDAFAVGPGDTLVRAASFPMAYERYDDTLIVGVCGRTFDWPDPASTRSAMRLVDALNERARVVVDELLRVCVDDTLDPGTICEVLALLVGLGFFAPPA